MGSLLEPVKYEGNDAGWPASSALATVAAGTRHIVRPPNGQTVPSAAGLPGGPNLQKGWSS